LIYFELRDTENQQLESIGVSPQRGQCTKSSWIPFARGMVAMKSLYPQHALLPDNYALAVSRLASVLKRLKRNPELFAEFNRIIEKQWSKGIISDVLTPYDVF